MSRQTPSSARDRLLDSAKRLFAAQGYEQTATSAIARDAGTSESQLMRYFGGKAGLLEALFDEAWSHINVRVEKALATTAAGHRESLLVALQTVVTALARDSNLASSLLLEGRRMRGSAPRVRLSRGSVAFAETIHRLIRNAQATHEIDPRFDTQAVTSALLGAAEALMRDRLAAKTGGGRSFAQREIRRTLEGMLAGLRGKPPAARGAVKTR